MLASIFYIKYCNILAYFRGHTMLEFIGLLTVIFLIILFFPAIITIAWNVLKVLAILAVILTVFVIFGM